MIFFNIDVGGKIRTLPAVGRRCPYVNMGVLGFDPSSNAITIAVFDTNYGKAGRGCGLRLG